MCDTPSHGVSATGIELTDDVLERMAEEAERGIDTSQLRRRPGRPPIGKGPAESFAVRLDPELRAQLNRRAAHDRTTAAAVIREALRRYLRAS